MSSSHTHMLRPYLSCPAKGPAAALSLSATTITPFPLPPTLFQPCTSAVRAVEIVCIRVSVVPFLHPFLAPNPSVRQPPSHLPASGRDESRTHTPRWPVLTSLVKAWSKGGGHMMGALLLLSVWRGRFLEGGPAAVADGGEVVAGGKPPFFFLGSVAPPILA